MSYCRLSQNDSDLHLVLTGQQTFLAMLARFRSTAVPPEVEAKPAFETELWLQQHEQPMGGRWDGETRELQGAPAVRQFLREALALGYRVPPAVWEQLEQEFPVCGSAPASQRPSRAR